MSTNVAPGNFVSATIVLTVTDSLGATLMQTIAASPTSFLGFVSNGTIATLAVGTATPGQFISPTVDELTIAIAALNAVPETATWSPLVAGLMALAYCSGRRRRSS